jgi:predicted enzyme related to lactoylglutathione lyase
VANWTISPGDWCHVELLTGDREAAKRYYGAVFGWRFDDIPARTR